MFEEPSYLMGFLGNVGSLDPMLHHYSGQHRDRIVAATYGMGGSKVRWLAVEPAATACPVT